MGRLFWVATLFAVVAALSPLWGPVALPNSIVTQTSQVRTVTPSQSTGYAVGNVTLAAVGAGSFLSGNLTIQGSPSNAGWFYIMTEAQFDAWKPTSGSPTNIAYTGTSYYIYNSRACTVTYPFGFTSNSTTDYYFVYQAGYSTNGQLGCPNYPSKYVPPRLTVLGSTQVLQSKTTSVESLGAVMSVVSIACYTANEVGWRRSKRKISG